MATTNKPVTAVKSPVFIPLRFTPIGAFRMFDKETFEDQEAAFAHANQQGASHPGERFVVVEVHEYQEVEELSNEG